MLCPKCRVECKVGKSYYKAVGDDSPTKQTKVYICHDMKCRNKKCEEYDTVVDTIENPVELEKEV